MADAELEYDFRVHDFGTNDEFQLSYFISLFVILLTVSIMFGYQTSRVWKLDLFPEAGGI